MEDVLSPGKIKIDFKTGRKSERKKTAVKLNPVIELSSGVFRIHSVTTVFISFSNGFFHYACETEDMYLFCKFNGSQERKSLFSFWNILSKCY